MDICRYAVIATIDTINLTCQQYCLSKLLSRILKNYIYHTIIWSMRNSYSNVMIANEGLNFKLMFNVQTIKHYEFYRVTNLLLHSFSNRINDTLGRASQIAYVHCAKVGQMKHGLLAQRSKWPSVHG